MTAIIFIVMFQFLSIGKQVHIILMSDATRNFPHIPMFKGKLSRMRAIEFVIRILVVCMLGKRVSGSAERKNYSTEAVSETTSCKQYHFYLIKGCLSLIGHFMVIYSVSLWRLCDAFFRQHHITKLSIKLR